MRPILIVAMAGLAALGACGPRDKAPVAGAAGEPQARDMILDDMLGRARERFDLADADGDGSLTAAERDEAAAAAAVAGRRGGSGTLARADANGDGLVTLAEMEAQTRARFERMDADHDGKVTPQERHAAFERRKSGG